MSLWGFPELSFSIVFVFSWLFAELAFHPCFLGEWISEVNLQPPLSKPCFPLWPLLSAVFAPQCFRGSRVAFGSPRVYFESIGYPCLSACWKRTYFLPCCIWKFSKNGRRKSLSWILGSYSEPKSWTSLLIMKP